MKKINLFTFIFFFCITSPFLSAAQTAKELPCKTIEEAEARLAKEQAETNRLRAELARLKALAAQSKNNELKLKTFSISFDCETYKNIPLAYENCLSAKKQSSPHERLSFPPSFRQGMVS